MALCSKLFLGAVFLAASFGAVSAQQVGDKDDQFVITGCIMQAENARTVGPHSIMVWSRGNVYLGFPNVRVKPSAAERVGTTGAAGTLFYWLDDEDDFAKYTGQRVEIVGELSDEIDRGQVEISTQGDHTEVAFNAGGREAKARIPTAWFGPTVRGGAIETDVAFRTVDVEKVSPLGPCTTQ